MESSSSRRPNWGGSHDAEKDLVAPAIDRSRVRSIYVEYDAMEQLRRDLQKGAAEVARADRNRRRRVRRARARLRRQSRRAAKYAVVSVRACASLAGRSAAALLRRSIRLTQLAVEHVERYARSAISAAGASSTRMSAARANRMPRRLLADVAQPPHAPLTPFEVVVPPQSAPLKTVMSLPPTAPKPAPVEHADDRDSQIAELDRRQLWLRENSLGRDHADVGLLALVVARRER